MSGKMNWLRRMTLALSLATVLALVVAPILPSGYPLSALAETGPTATAVPTPIPATPTIAALATSPTPAATDTAVPPTATPTATVVTPSPTATATDVPPTPTATIPAAATATTEATAAASPSPTPTAPTATPAAPSPTVSPSPSAPVSTLVLTVDPPVDPIAAGGAATYAVTVANQGTVADTVTLAATSASPDLKLAFDAASLSVSAGGTAKGTLTASAAKGASGSLSIVVSASGASGAKATAAAAADVFTVAFDRALKGDRVGQHKVPPTSKITVQISAKVSTALSKVTLVDHLPAGWSVADPKGGVVGPAGSARTIRWDLGPVAAGGVVTASYDVQSPALTTPPTAYDFASELDWPSGTVQSDPWQVVVGDAPLAAPSAPYAMGLGSSTIGVAWVPANDATITGYKLYRSTTETGTFSLVLTTTGGQLASSAEDSGLAASTTYFYRVTAYTATAESSQVGPVSATTTAPAPPKGPRATGGTGSISLAWNASPESNLRGYNVYRATTSGGSFVKLNATPVAATTYVDSGSGLKPVSYYYYRVTAVDGTSAEGKPSGEVSAKLLYRLSTSGPHGGYSATTNTCATCHRTHTAPGQDLTSASAERNLCFACHDGTGSQYDIKSELSGAPTSSHPIISDTVKCSSCHDSHLSPQTNPKILDVGGVRSGNPVCYACHGVGTTLLGGDHQTPWEAGYHKAVVPTPPSGTGVQCSTCHQAHASPSRSLEIEKDENTCYSCHDGSTAGANVLTKFTAGSSPNSHHNISDADQAATGAKVECVNCHNPHTTASTSKVVNPSSPSMANIWTGTTTAFCESCHDGTYPTATQTEPYAPAVQGPTTPLINVASTYSSSPHGALSCVDCHDSHGSPNAYMLRTSVTPSGSATAKNGLIVIPVATGGYDTRFFCNACHDAGQMGNQKPLPSDCTSCHKHGTRF